MPDPGLCGRSPLRPRLFRPVLGAGRRV